MRRRQLIERPVGPPVELNEDVVPELDEALVPGIDPDLKVSAVRRIAALGAAVDVDFGAGTARPRVPHLPEVIRLAKTENARGIDVRLGRPQLGRLLVRWETVCLVTSENRDPDAVLREPPDVGQQVPRPADRLLLEVVAERPVPEHLKERVVVCIDTHFFEVVVLAGDADALLGVSRADVVSLSRTEKDVLELVHPCIGEQQRGVVLRKHRPGRDHLVASLTKELKEVLTDLLRGFHA